MLVQTQTAHFPAGLALRSGNLLAPLTLAYETYGTLAPERDNAILILHALSGDAHAAGRHHPSDRRPGWWDSAIGPGRPFDTDRHFLICANVPGGCAGSTGPLSLHPADGLPYGPRFPLLSIADMAEAQRLLLDHLAIPRLNAVAGGSMGGMQALQFALQHPARVRKAVILASSARPSALNIALNEAARQAIRADAHWHGGHYARHGQVPRAGLSAARMIGHLTYLSENAMEAKFGRRLQHPERLQRPGQSLDPEFAVESYLHHQGASFVDRFDANSFMVITKALDCFDPALHLGHGSLPAALATAQADFLVAGYHADWLYPPAHSRHLAEALRAAGKNVQLHEFSSDYGHDAFLTETHHLEAVLPRFLASEEKVEG